MQVENLQKHLESKKNELTELEKSFNPLSEKHSNIRQEIREIEYQIQLQDYNLHNLKELKHIMQFSDIASTTEQLEKNRQLVFDTLLTIEHDEKDLNTDIHIECMKACLKRIAEESLEKYFELNDLERIHKEKRSFDLQKDNKHHNGYEIFEAIRRMKNEK